MPVEGMWIQTVQPFLKTCRVDGAIQHGHCVRQACLKQRKWQFPAPHPGKVLPGIEGRELRQGQVSLFRNSYHAYIPFIGRESDRNWPLTSCTNSRWPIRLIVAPV